MVRRPFLQNRTLLTPAKPCETARLGSVSSLGAEKAYEKPPHQEVSPPEQTRKFSWVEALAGY
jgi:hypothetical protein